MTTTETLITDPDALPGFVERDGIRVSFVGDDGEQLLAIGHHEPAAVVAAFLQMASAAGWRTDDFDDATERLEACWAKFTEEPGTPISPSSNWWCDWSAKEPAPGLIPVTVLDYS